MFKRKAWEKLRKWKQEQKRKALCIVGARQIGKTTLVRQFGAEEYECFAEINFVTSPSAKEIFNGDLSAETLIRDLTAFLRKPLTIGNTLILLDEIQECPNARTAIKFLVEDGRFDFIETGSLLGVRFKEVSSLPVGFEEIYRMYPMDFEEYALANGVQNSTFEYLKDCFDRRVPVSESIHRTMTQLFYSYLVIGGMPQVVNTFIETNDIGRVIQNQKDILELYRLDISRYAVPSERVKIQSIFDSIPSQLNDKNRRFFLSKIDETGRQNRYENCFVWLADAGVALPCFNVTEPCAPLQMNEKRSLMKLFMGDTGLLCAACMENVQFDLLKGHLEVNLGSILENMAAQALKSNDFRLNYFDSKKYGEIDFVVQNGLSTELIEIKSGNDYKKHSVLDRVLAVKQWNFTGKYVFCKSNVEEEEGILYLPWYFLMNLKPKEVPSEFTYHLDLSNL